MQYIQYLPRTFKVTSGKFSYRLIVLILTTAYLFWPVPHHAQTAQGGLDAGFGTSGKVISNTSKAFKAIRAVALQSKAQILVAGFSSGKKSQQAFVGRYLRDGSLDAMFGDAGFAGIAANFRAATAMAIQPDNKILVAGSLGPDFGLARLKKNGALDKSFGNAGVVATDFLGGNDAAWALALQPDGKVVVAGSIGRGHADQFGLARYNPDGGLDPAFGSNGKITIDFATNLSQALAVAVQPDGKIVAAGLASNGVNNDFALARLNADGSLDATFGLNGLVAIDSAGRQDRRRRRS